MVFFYTGAALVFVSLIFILPRSRKKKEDFLALLQQMEEGLLELKQELNRVKREIKERQRGANSFQSYLQQEMAFSSRRVNRGDYGENRTLKFQEVKAMVDAGYDREQIAQDLQLGHRELRLILKMKGWG